MRTIEEILSDLSTINDLATTENRSFSDDEVTRISELEAELAQVRTTTETRARIAAYNTPVHSVVVASPQVSAEERAFNDYLRGNAEDSVYRMQTRAQSVGSNTAGGYTVPPGFLARLEKVEKAFGGVANVAEMITTASGESIRFPSLDDTANEGEIAAEGSSGTGGHDLVFGNNTIGSFKYTAPGADNSGDDPLRVSVELLEDSAFDISGLVTQALGERIARKQADDWVNGAGTTEPFGLSTSGGPSYAFVSDSSHLPTYVDLINAVHSIDPAYRRGSCVWTFNDTTLSAIRQMVDGNGRPLWIPQAASGMEDIADGSLLGYPVVIDQAWADFEDGSQNTFGAFGDIRRGYLIRKVGSPRLVVDPYTRAAQGQVCYTLIERADGMVKHAKAFALLKNDATS